MNKIWEILKRKLCVFKFTTKDNEKYFLNVESEQLIEDEYELIKDFMTRKEEEEENE